MAVIRNKGDEVMAGTIEVECAQCEALIPVQVYVRADVDEDGDDALYTRCDVSDTWAHAWSAHGDN